MRNTHKVWNEILGGNPEASVLNYSGQDLMFHVASRVKIYTIEVFNDGNKCIATLKVQPDQMDRLLPDIEFYRIAKEEVEGEVFALNRLLLDLHFRLYFFQMDSREADNTLTEGPSEAGTYLIRPSSDLNKLCTLSCARKDDRPIHYRLDSADGLIPFMQVIGAENGAELVPFAMDADCFKETVRNQLDQLFVFVEKGLVQQKDPGEPFMKRIEPYSYVFSYGRFTYLQRFVALGNLLRLENEGGQTLKALIEKEIQSVIVPDCLERLKEEVLFPMLELAQNKGSRDELIKLLDRVNEILG